MKNRRHIIIFALVIGVIALLAVRYPYALNTQDARFQLVYWLILLALVGRGVFVARNAPIPRLLRDLGIWLVFLLVLVALYTYREELSHSRFAAALLPTRPVTQVDGTITIAMAEDGHFYAEAEVNGAPVLFMIDTGATDIVLTPKDAQAAGFDVQSLTYDRLYHTANGTGSGAGVILDTLTLNHIRMTDISASVNQEEMRESLLGMAFFKRLKGFQVEGDTLTIKP